MTRATLTFLGAARTVTGSRFLIRTEEAESLVDCGLFQGERVWRRRNWEPFQADPAKISSVALTHAHLDHCGYLPALVRNGFHGPVLCTPATAALTAIVLRDAAHLQEEDAAHARRAGFSKHDPPLPLFDQADAEKAIALLRPTPFGKTAELPGVGNLVLHHAGHILGSAFAEVRIGGRSLLVSGDMGRHSHPLLNPPEDPPGADTVLVESTYGDREHESLTMDRLASTIRRTAGRGGVVLMPAFAVDRTPVLLHHIKMMTDANLIPPLPVYVDSPMALAALEVYRQAIHSGSEEIRPELIHDDDALNLSDLHMAHSVEESMGLNDPHFPCIVISASGMATGGRVLHHLRHLLPQPRNTVVMAGFQVAGTRGQQLLDGAKTIKIHGKYVPVRADVVAAPYFSAHADADELVGWLARAPRPPDNALVVHGERGAADALAERLGGELGWTAVVPRYLETVLLS